MVCLFCQKEMICGAIYGDRYQLKWMPKDNKLILGIWVHDSIPVGKLTFGRPNVDASYYENYKKISIF